MFVEDLTPFFAEFGVDATLDGQPVRVIFDTPYAEAMGGMSTRQTQVTAPSASVDTATKASVLIVAGTSFRVISPQPDGTGITTLVLQRQP